MLGAKFSSTYNTSTGASKYIQIVKNHYPPNFQNFPKLCITFNLKVPIESYFVTEHDDQLTMRMPQVHVGHYLLEIICNIFCNMSYLYQLQTAVL